MPTQSMADEMFQVLSAAIERAPTHTVDLVFERRCPTPGGANAVQALLDTINSEGLMKDQVPWAVTCIGWDPATTGGVGVLLQSRSPRLLN